jgi:heme exporter protein CcmD
MDSIWAFNSWAAFFEMGGHSFYVWSSYGAFAVLLLLLIIVTYMQFNSWKKSEIRRLERTQLQNLHRQKEV